MNKSYVLHLIELGAIIVLIILVLNPKLFSSATQQSSLPPIGNLDTVEDVYNDLQQLGCEIIHVDGEYSLNRFETNITEFRKVVMKPKLSLWS